MSIYYNNITTIHFIILNNLAFISLFRNKMAKSRSKKSMPCNRPQKSWKPAKKRVVKACSGGKEKIIHFGATGYGHNYSTAARKSFRARHRCSTANDKLSARYWACKDLWTKGGSSQSCPKNRKCKLTSHRKSPRRKSRSKRKSKSRRKSRKKSRRKSRKSKSRRKSRKKSRRKSRKKSRRKSRKSKSRRKSRKKSRRKSRKKSRRKSRRRRSRS
jgi:hypothetical protein